MSIEVTKYGTANAKLFIELPHGATRPEDYAGIAKTLKSPLPADLDHFFYVNTDEGTPEGGAYLGEELADLGVLVARCLLPRTFVDTNRVIDRARAGQMVEGMTAGLPGYITDPADIAELVARHADYHEAVAELYGRVCGNGGLAVQLHSYSPRSVGVDATDANIVDALHKAYVPAVYETWPKRPSVDLICATKEGDFRCNPELVAEVRAAYTAAGIQNEENATYHMHPITMGMHYAKAYPDRVLCIELDRGLLGDPFVPFASSVISPAKVAMMMAPLAAVLRARLS